MHRFPDCVSPTGSWGQENVVSETKRVFIVDDRISDLIWLLDLIRRRGYEVILATNEQAARKRLEAVQRGEERYVLAIIDVMVATHDLLELVALDEKFFKDSRNTGIRLCTDARKEFGISPEVLPIVCLTAREDEEVKTAMRDLGIPLFHRAPHSPEESIRGFVEEHLPVLTPEQV
jgi:DNA-binding response OmpR family regulator